MRIKRNHKYCREDYEQNGVESAAGIGAQIILSPYSAENLWVTLLGKTFLEPVNSISYILVCGGPKFSLRTEIPHFYTSTRIATFV